MKNKDPANNNKFEQNKLRKKNYQSGRKAKNMWRDANHTFPIGLF